MTSDRFDIGTIRALAGDKVFARGEAYHRNGYVALRERFARKRNFIKLLG